MLDYLYINSRDLAAFQRCHYPVSDMNGKQLGRLNRIKGNLRDLAESGDGASVLEDKPERVECALPREHDVTREESVVAWMSVDDKGYPESRTYLVKMTVKFSWN